jgi:hypothetical protein
MRESRTYGSVRGARNETRVPTATAAGVYSSSLRRARLASRRPCAAAFADDRVPDSAWCTEFAHLLAAFQQGLTDAGYVEGRNIAIEYWWAEGQYHRLPALAADPARRQLAVIAATGSDPGDPPADPAPITDRSLSNARAHGPYRNR